MSHETPQEFIEARVAILRQHADAVCDFIIENIAGGIVLEDEDDSPTITIQFYVDDSRTGYREQLSAYLKSIMTEPGIEIPDVNERRIKNLEWIDEYRSSVKPIRIADDIVVRPPWHPTEPDTKYDIVIEPRMAFGTGTHETTRS